MPSAMNRLRRSTPVETRGYAASRRLVRCADLKHPSEQKYTGGNERLLRDCLALRFNSIFWLTHHRLIHFLFPTARLHARHKLLAKTKPLGKQLPPPKLTMDLMHFEDPIVL